MAISKQRLEELIEQEATVWFVSGNEVVPFWLFNHYKYVDYEETNLYETKEDAEFVAKYHTSRVERFEPPTWEEVQKNGLCYWYFVGKNKSRYVISVDLPYNKDLGVIFVANMNSRVVVTDEYICIKENYIKAVEKARKLFLGESDD